MKRLLAIAVLFGWCMMALGAPAASAPTSSPTPASKAVGPQPLPWANASPSPVGPQNDKAVLGGDRLTLDECLEYARNNHPTLLAAQAQYEQALARVRQSQALYVPTVGFQVQRTHTYTQDGGIAPGAVSTIAAFAFNPVVTNIMLQPTLSFSYLLNDGGKRRLSVSRDMTDLLTYVLNWRTQWRKLALQVEQDYLAIDYNRALLAVQQDSIQMSMQTLRQAEGLFRAGKKTRLDALQAQTDLLSARTSANQQLGVLNKAWAALAADLGVPLNQFATIDPMLTETWPVPTRDRVLNLAFVQRSDVVSYSNQIEVRKEQLAVNRTALQPTLQTLLSFGYLGADFPMLRTFSAQLTLAIPLSSQPGVKAQNQEIVGQIGELLANTNALRLQIIGDVNRDYIGMMEASQRVEVAESQVKMAEQSFRLAFRRYKSGLSEFIEVTNARSVLNNARIAWHGARNDRASAELQLFADMEAALPLPILPAAEVNPPQAASTSAAPAAPTPLGHKASKKKHVPTVRPASSQRTAVPAGQP